MSKIQKIPIKDLMPNPFRHKDHQTEEGKINALIDSYRSSGVWPTIVCRKHNGHIQRAFGDNRIEAAKKLYGLNHEIEVTVEEISDIDMLRMMADENKDEWKTSFAVTLEVIEAVVKAYGEGKIELEVPPQGHRRYAPSFRVGKEGDSHSSLDRPYTPATVGKFLNWKGTPKGGPNWTIPVALEALELIESGIANRSIFDKLTPRQAQSVIDEIRLTQKRIAGEQEVREKKLRKTKDEKAAKDIQKQIDVVAQLPAEVGDTVSKALKEGEGFRASRSITNKLTEGRGVKTLPPSGKFIAGLCKELAAFLSASRSNTRVKKLQAILGSKDDLPKGQVDDVAEMLIGVAQVCVDWAMKFNPEIEFRMRDTHRSVRSLRNHERALKS